MAQLYVSRSAFGYTKKYIRPDIVAKYYNAWCSVDTENINVTFGGVRVRQCGHCARVDFQSGSYHIDNCTILRAHVNSLAGSHHRLSIVVHDQFSVSFIAHAHANHTICLFNVSVSQNRVRVASVVLYHDMFTRTPAISPLCVNESTKAVVVNDQNSMKVFAILETDDSVHIVPFFEPGRWFGNKLLCLGDIRNDGTLSVVACDNRQRKASVFCANDSEYAHCGTLDYPTRCDRVGAPFVASELNMLVAIGSSGPNSNYNCVVSWDPRSPRCSSVSQTIAGSTSAHIIGVDEPSNTMTCRFCNHLVVWDLRCMTRSLRKFFLPIYRSSYVEFAKHERQGIFVVDQNHGQTCLASEFCISPLTRYPMV
jgi:hypothetical protein